MQLKAGLGGALEQRQALENQLAALAAQQQSLSQAVCLCFSEVTPPDVHKLPRSVL